MQPMVEEEVVEFLVMVELERARRDVLSASVLAERARIELPTASKVLKLLAAAGLVRSFRGPSGGYTVDREAQDISVAEIIAAAVALVVATIEAPDLAPEVRLFPCDVVERGTLRRGAG